MKTVVKPTHIYVSGPMRDRDGFNFPAFFEAETRLREMFPEADICNPAREDVVRFGMQEMLAEDPTGLTAGRWLMEGGSGQEFGEAELRDALGRDMAYIAQFCDLVVLLDGWEKSGGAKAEAALAEALGQPVVLYKTLSEARRPGQVASGTAPSPSGAPGGVSEAPASSFVPLTERRATSATGGEKGVKLAAFDQINPFIEWELAEHFGMGARKYAAHNFRRGYPWSQSYSALRRHLAEFWSGKVYDDCPENCPDHKGEFRVLDGRRLRICPNHTGSRHIIAALWHANALAEFSHYPKFKEYDDRYVYTNHE